MQQKWSKITKTQKNVSCVDLERAIGHVTVCLVEARSLADFGSSTIVLVTVGEQE